MRKTTKSHGEKIDKDIKRATRTTSTTEEKTCIVKTVSTTGTTCMSCNFMPRTRLLNALHQTPKP